MFPIASHGFLSWLESLGSNKGSVGSAPWEVGSLWRPGQPTYQTRGLNKVEQHYFFICLICFGMFEKKIGGTGTSMAIHQWFKAWSTLAILHQNQKIKGQILTNHSPVDLPRPGRKHLKQTCENPSFFTQRNLGLFGKKNGFISQWSIKGRVANHDGCFSIRLRPRNPK